MFPILFKKSRAEEILAAIENGTPIAPPADGWNVNDNLQMAGAFFFAGSAPGPLVYMLDREKYANLHSEQREFEDVQFRSDLIGAVNYVGLLTMQVADNEYDENYDPEIILMLRNHGNESEIFPISGFKNE